MLIRRIVTLKLLRVAALGGLTALTAVLGARALRKGRRASPRLLTRLRIQAAMAGAAAVLGTIAARKVRRLRRMAMLLRAPSIALVAIAAYLSAWMVLRNRGKLTGAKLG